MKKYLMPLTGCIAFFAFLALCLEPAPGENMGEWNFLWLKFFALAVMFGCVWAIKKLDNKI